LAEHDPVPKGVLIVAVACAIVTTSVRQGLADDGSPLASWLAQKTATGTWGGTRDALELRGVTVELGYAADFAGNVSGGDRRGSGYAGFAVAGVGVDLDKLMSLPGMALTMSGLWASGRDVSGEDIGNLFAVQQAFAPGDVYLGQLALSQSLLGDTLTIQAGRLFAGDVFATSPLWNYYVSGGINANLNSISSNIFFPVTQATTWGARVFYQPTREWGFIVGGYNTDPTVAAPSKHGVDFSLDMSKGALTIAQVTYSHNQSRDLTGLPGSVSLGGYYARGRFPQLDDPTRTDRGNYGLYLYFDQMLYRGDWLEYLGPEHLRADASYALRGRHPYIHEAAAPKDRAHGLTVWGAVYVAPRDAINPQMVQAAGGLLYHGMFPGRDHDVTAVGVISGIFSERLPQQGAETVIEVNHRFQLTRWFYVTPDFQYVIHPNGFGSVGNAAVFAGEVAIAF
jgi:porin